MTVPGSIGPGFGGPAGISEKPEETEYMDQRPFSPTSRPGKFTTPPLHLFDNVYTNKPTRRSSKTATLSFKSPTAKPTTTVIGNPNPKPLASGSSQGTGEEYDMFYNELKNVSTGDNAKEKEFIDIISKEVNRTEEKGKGAAVAGGLGDVRDGGPGGSKDGRSEKPTSTSTAAMTKGTEKMSLKDAKTTMTSTTTLMPLDTTPLSTTDKTKDNTKATKDTTKTSSDDLSHKSSEFSTDINNEIANSFEIQVDGGDKESKQESSTGKPTKGQPKSTPSKLNPMNPDTIKSFRENLLKKEKANEETSEKGKHEQTKDSSGKVNSDKEAKETGDTSRKHLNITASSDTGDIGADFNPFDHLEKKPHDTVDSKSSNDTATALSDLGKNVPDFLKEYAAKHQKKESDAQKEAKGSPDSVTDKSTSANSPAKLPSNQGRPHAREHPFEDGMTEKSSLDITSRKTPANEDTWKLESPLQSTTADVYNSNESDNLFDVPEEKQTAKSGLNTSLEINSLLDGSGTPRNRYM